MKALIKTRRQLKLKKGKNPVDWSPLGGMEYLYGATVTIRKNKDIFSDKYPYKTIYTKEQKKKQNNISAYYDQWYLKEDWIKEIIK